MDTFLANVSFYILGIVLFLTTIGELIIVSWLSMVDLSIYSAIQTFLLKVTDRNV